MWSSRSLSQQPEPVLQAAARPRQRQRASLSACQGVSFSEGRRSTPDRLDQFLHSSSHRHLNNNEASVTDSEPSLTYC